MAATPVLFRGVHEPQTPLVTRATYPAATTAGPYFLSDVAPAKFLDKLTKLCGPAWAAGLTPLWTWKPTAADVAAGVWDMPVKRVRDYHLAMGVHSIAYPWHEPEDNMTGKDFIGIFNRIYPLLSAPPWIMCGYTAMAYQWRPGSPTTANPKDWTPYQTDFYGVDVYSGQGFSSTATLANHPGFQRWHDTIVKGPFMVCERGFTGTGRADTMAAECEYLGKADTPVIGYQMWNAPGTNNPTGWLFDTAATSNAVAIINCLAGKHITAG